MKIDRRTTQLQEHTGMTSSSNSQRCQSGSQPHHTKGKFLQFPFQAHFG